MVECSRRYAHALVGFCGQLLPRLYRVGLPLPPPPLATVSCSRHSGARRGQPLLASGAAPFITLSRPGPDINTVSTVRRREVERHLKRSLATLGAPVGQTPVAMMSTFAVGRFLSRDRCPTHTSEFLLYGPAGSGKSSIAELLALRCTVAPIQKVM